jgi:hypothetical protein
VRRSTSNTKALEKYFRSKADWPLGKLQDTRFRSYYLMTINWEEITSVATAIYGSAFLISLLFVVIQLRRQSGERFVVSTQKTFEIWMTDDFQKAQQWILYELKEQTWKEFVAAHRGGYGERAFIRVGSYYTRIGYLVTYRLLGTRDRILLDTVAGSAIIIWQKIEPLVLEARLVENSTLFQDYERMLPRCRECYVCSETSQSAVDANGLGEESLL